MVLVCSRCHVGRFSIIRNEKLSHLAGKKDFGGEHTVHLALIVSWLQRHWLAGLNFFGIDPIKALIFTAVINGIATVPLLYMIARVGNNKAIMGEYKWYMV